MKKNIPWLKTKENKPHINNDDAFSKEQQESVKVLVWIDTYGPRFGIYYYKSDHWSIEGINGLHNDRVTHFAYIQPPLNF